uniref:Ribosomal protein S11 n=1 Tax=Panagrolaimus sp. ES5 TaxID=591445 RepID=A0AC34GBH3_9BILA
MIRPAGSPTATLLRLLPGSNQCDQIDFHLSGQRRAVSSFTNNNYNIRSQIRNNLTRLPILYRNGHTRCNFHCSARAAPDILGHHRPVIAGFLTTGTPQIPLRRKESRFKPRKE